jgi:hypothetical protein
MQLLRLLQESTETPPEPNHPASCQPRDAPESLPLKEHDGRESTGSRRSFQLRSPNERCPPRLVAKSQPRNVRGGRRSRAQRRRLERDEAWYTITALSLIHPQLKIGYRQPATLLLTRSGTHMCCLDGAGQPVLAQAGAHGNRIRQLLELTKLTSVFEVHPTLDAATFASRGQAA